MTEAELRGILGEPCNVPTDPVKAALYLCFVLTRMQQSIGKERTTAIHLMTGFPDPALDDASRTLAKLNGRLKSAGWATGPAGILRLLSTDRSQWPFPPASVVGL